MVYKVIPPNEHVFVAGQTQSGKTQLARVYLAGYKNVVVLDTKGLFRWPEAIQDEITLITRLSDIDKVDTPKIIYRPIAEEMEFEWYNHFYQWCYDRQNCIVYTDETTSVCDTAGKIPRGLKNIYARGMERGTAAWSLTQRPMHIPQIIISESRHHFIFNLQLPQDRKKIQDITGMNEFQRKPGKYNFWYWCSEEAEPPALGRLVLPK